MDRAPTVAGLYRIKCSSQKHPSVGHVQRDRVCYVLRKQRTVDACVPLERGNYVSVCVTGRKPLPAGT